MTLESELVKTMLYIERYHGDSLGIIQDNLATAQKNILGYVADETNQVKIKKYIKDEMSSAFEGIDEDVIQDIEHIQGTTWDAMGATMAQGFVTNGLANAFVNYKNVSDGVKKRLNNEARLVQGHTLKDHFKHLTATNTRKLQGLIVDGQSKGLGVQEINRNIRNTLGNVNRNQVSTLVRTTLLEAAEEAKNESMDFFSDEILEWRYSAVMDSRTSKVCFVNNGIRHKKQSDFKVKPKNHYQCRSMFVPITELSEQLEGDAKIVQWDGSKTNHRDGTTSTKFKVGDIKSVPKNASAETYFKAFDTEYQIKYMGVKRYNLWKSGKMGFDEAFGVSRKSSLSIGAVKSGISKVKVPEIKFGYDGKFDGYVKDIRDEAKIVISKAPIPNIKKSSKRGSYDTDSQTLTTIAHSKTFIHEYGHHIDDYAIAPLERAGGRIKIKQTLSSRKSFLEAYEADKIKYSTINIDKVVEIIDESGYDTKTKKAFGISDIMDSFRGGHIRQFKSRSGHGIDGYMSDVTKRSETFANLFEIYSRKSEWKRVVELFPNLAKEFESIIGELQ